MSPLRPPHPGNTYRCGVRSAVAIVIMLLVVDLAHVCRSDSEAHKPRSLDLAARPVKAVLRPTLGHLMDPAAMVHKGLVKPGQRSIASAQGGTRSSRRLVEQTSLVEEKEEPLVSGSPRDQEKQRRTGETSKVDSFEARKKHAVEPMAIFEMWSKAYGVESNAFRTLKLEEHATVRLRQNSTNFPPWDSVMRRSDRDILDLAPTGDGTLGPVGLENDSCPRGPHLLCCNWLTQLRADAERRGLQGEAPKWTEPQKNEAPGEESYPRPPWVRGTPKDNLPLTHRVQTDIWLHQFPADDCANESTRFLISWWDKPEGHGIGSHLHLMTAMLGTALQSNRVLVILNNSFSRAEHNGCKAVGMYGSFGCYFALPTSKACEAKAMAAWKNITGEWRSSSYFRAEDIKRTPDIMDILHSDQKWLAIAPLFAVYQAKETYPMKWGEPWVQCDGKNNIGKMFDPSNPGYVYGLKANWWRSQGIRFLMRWPSAYLCHLINFGRHQTYGLQLARSWADSQMNKMKECYFPDRACPAEAAALSNVNGIEDLQLQAQGHPVLALVRGEAQAKAQTEAYLALGLPPVNLLPQAYLPHPIVQVHYRGSDKFLAGMKVIHLATYLKEAEGILRRVLKATHFNVWLISEEQRVFEEARKLTNWTIYSLEMEKKFGGSKEEPTNQWYFAQRFGVQDYVEASLTNLFICELSDGLVLPLESNWGRLMNELRLTGGRLNVSMISVNYNEFP